MDSWSRMARQSCPDCGSRRLRWMAAVDLPFFVDDLASRKRAVEVIAWEGGDSDAWLCTECGYWGIFGPTSFVIPPAAPGASFRRRA